MKRGVKMSDPKDDGWEESMKAQATKAIEKMRKRRAGIYLECAIGALLDVFPTQEVIKRLNLEADHLGEFVRGG
jgi:hypothetical protein